jgi:quercetin dioxygenase-like cupin family protein
MTNFVDDLKIVDNVFVKMIKLLRTGDTYPGHAHVFDHITLLATGSVIMTHDKGSQEFKAPHLIVTPKGITHEFKALEDSTTLCCIHAIRDGNSVDDVAPQDIDISTAEELIMAKYPVTLD